MISCREEYELPLKNPGKKPSGYGYVTGLNSVDSKVLFAVELPQSGKYVIVIGYATTTGQRATSSLYINDIKTGDQLVMPKTADETAWQTVEQSITLQKGLNYIAVQCDEGDNGLFNLDYIQIKY